MPWCSHVAISFQFSFDVFVDIFKLWLELAMKDLGPGFLPFFIRPISHQLLRLASGLSPLMSPCCFAS